MKYTKIVFRIGVCFLFLLSTHFRNVHAQFVVDSVQLIAEGEGGFTGTFGVEDAFGASIVDLGDLDGDGVSDLAVGNNYVGTGCSECTGEIYILFMNSDGTVKTHQLIREGEGGFTGDLESFDRFGTALANLGDFNNDGTTDLLVGSDGDEEGAVWLLFLNSDGSVKENLKIDASEGGFTGPLTGALFGSSVVNLGDFDGDNITDIVVGASRDEDGGEANGAVWILYLKEDGTVKGHKKLGGNTKGLFQEHSINFEDIEPGSIVREVYSNNGFGPIELQGFQGTCNEQAAVILDSSNPTGGNYDLGTPNQTFGGPGIGKGGEDGSLFANDSMLGNMLVLHDQCDELSSGSVDNPSDSEERGEYVFTFPETVTLTGYTVVDTDKRDEHNITIIKDINTTPLVFQTPSTRNNGKAVVQTDENEPEAGVTLTSRARIERIGSSGLDDISFRTSLFDASFGREATEVGDLDGNGVTDLAVVEGLSGFSGGVWIVFLEGDASVKSIELIARGEGGLPEDLEYTFFGLSVANIGDLDNDGLDEIAVGVSGGADNGEADVWVLFLTPEGTVRDYFKITNLLDSSDFPGLGSSVNLIGDLDGNGIRDLAIGSIAYNSEGAIWILFLDDSSPALAKHLTIKDVPGVVEEKTGILSLDKAYPNPFNPSTNIRFSVPQSEYVRLVVYDMLGREVRRLVDGVLEAGRHEINFDAENLPSGSYLYRLETLSGSYTKTMLLMK